jgi:hypothetical protein
MTIGATPPTHAASLKAQTPPVPDPAKQPQGAAIIAHYYGDVMPYEQLAAEKSKTGQYVHCVVRTGNPDSIVIHEDCYNTISESDRKANVYRKAVSSNSVQPLSGCFKWVSLFYNAGYNSVIPWYNQVCSHRQNDASYMYSDNMLYEGTCFRVYDFANYNGNSSAVCATYFYYYHAVGSFQYLG